MKSFLLLLGVLLSSACLRANPEEPHAPAAAAEAQAAPHAEPKEEPSPTSAPVSAAAEPVKNEADAHASASPTAAAPEKTAPTAAEPATGQELASLLRIGDGKVLQQDWDSARLAYTQVLAAGRHAPPAQIRAALLGLARTYRGDRRLTKACAVYERYLKDYPEDDQLPLVFLELGRCLRALGAHRLAIARFYSVINTTLKLPEEGPDTYRQLARTAQFEIAETYFQSGDYDQAYRFYSRLRLLDLAPTDRARAAFKSACALNLKGDDEKAVTQLRAYLSLYPDGEDAPETRYLLSLTLRRLGRSQESLSAALALLQTENARASAHPENWVRWQRKTGNQLANEFYEQGDISTALTIYQCLRTIGGPPEWLLPVQYQIGLCQERLRQTETARATYQSILDPIRNPVADNAKNHAVLDDLAVMVAWRLKHLDWVESTEKRIQSFDAPDATNPRPAALSTPAS